MKLFIWKRANETTDSYHSEAGVVVFADSLQDARDILGEKIQSDGIKKESEVFSKAPDIEIEVSEITKSFYIFPDAGCC